MITQAPLSFAIALVLLFAALWWGFSIYYRHRLEMKDDTILNLERKLEHGSHTRSAVNIPPSIEFFPTIDDLRAAHPLPKTFSRENEIHAYFLSGEGVFTEHTDYIKCVKRLILPNPYGANIERLKPIAPSVNYETQILTCRQMALDHDPKSVRLYKDFLGMSLLFCNPNKQEGWVQIGPILPYTEPRERPHFRLYRANNEGVFLSLYGTFDKLWNDSYEETYEDLL